MIELNYLIENFNEKEQALRRIDADLKEKVVKIIRSALSIEVVYKSGVLAPDMSKNFLVIRGEKVGRLIVAAQGNEDIEYTECITVDKDGLTSSYIIEDPTGDRYIIPGVDTRQGEADLCFILR